MIASPFGSGRAGLGQVVAVRAVVGRLRRISRDELDLVRLRRRHEVVEERAAAGEPLDPEQLLGIQAAVGCAMLGVPLLGNAAVRT